MKGQDYDALLEEVLYFFKKVKTGSDLEESIEEFELDISNNCGIEVAEEIGFSNTGGENDRNNNERRQKIHI